MVAVVCGLTAWNVMRSSALDEAEAAYARGDLAAALRRALDHLDRRPWSREATRLTALSLSRLDFPDEAEPYYRRLPAPTLDELNTRALGLIQSNRRGAGVRALEAILRRWPDDRIALSRLAAMMIAQTKMDEALALAERLERAPGGAVPGATLIGTIRHGRDEHEESVAAFERVLARDPTLAAMPLPREQFWTHFATGLLSLGRAERAARVLGRALAEKDDPGLYDLLGRAHHQLGRPDEAERAYRRAIELEPDLGTAWLGLARLELERDRPRGTLDVLKEAEGRGLNRYDSLYLQLRAHHRLGHAAEAKALQALIDDLRHRAGMPTTGMGAMPAAKP